MSPFPLKINAVAFPTKDKCCPFFGWYRRSVAQFTAVGAAFHTTVRVNAACFSAVGVGVMLPILLLLVPPFTTARVNDSRFSAVGVGVLLPIVLLLVPPLPRRLG